jgi:hypothetical protein
VFGDIDKGTRTLARPNRECKYDLKMNQNTKLGKVGKNTLCSVCEPLIDCCEQVDEHFCFHGVLVISSLAEELRDSHQGLLMLTTAFRVIEFKWNAC